MTANVHLIESWRLELLGAAYFEGIAQVAEEPNATTARLLASVERKMASELQDLLEQGGWDHAHVPDEAIEAALRKGKEAGWSGFVGSLASVVAPAISLYLQLSKSDPKLGFIADRLIQHEQLLEVVSQLPAAVAQQRIRLFLDIDLAEPLGTPPTKRS